MHPRFNDRTYTPSSKTGIFFSLFFNFTPHRDAQRALDDLKNNLPQNREKNTLNINRLRAYFNDFHDLIHAFPPPYMFALLDYDSRHDYYKTDLGQNFIRLLHIYERLNYRLNIHDRPNADSMLLLVPVLLEVLERHPSGKIFLQQFILMICQLYLVSPSKQLALAFIEAINHPLFDPNEHFCDEHFFHPILQSFPPRVITLTKCLYRECRADSLPASQNAYTLTLELFKLKKLNRIDTLLEIESTLHKPEECIPLKKILAQIKYDATFAPLRLDPSLYLSRLCQDVFLIIGALVYPELESMPTQVPIIMAAAASAPPVCRRSTR